jgi:hypothetical protein
LRERPVEARVDRIHCARCVRRTRLTSRSLARMASARDGLQPRGAEARLRARC